MVVGVVIAHCRDQPPGYAGANSYPSVPSLRPMLAIVMMVLRICQCSATDVPLAFSFLEFSKVFHNRRACIDLNLKFSSPQLVFYPYSFLVNVKQTRLLSQKDKNDSIGKPYVADSTRPLVVRETVDSKLGASVRAGTEAETGKDCPMQVI